jgi:hypothetical protein
MWKSLVHPDAKRGYAAVAVVAVDLRRTDLHLIAGSQEPASSTVPTEHRPGVIPRDALPDLVAAFNGGFKAMHGHYGMMLDGRTFAAPRETSCTVAIFKDGSIGIRAWPAVKPREGDLAAYRQTPPCLVEEGHVADALLTAADAKGWGESVSGETAIRRSALGLDRAGRTMFYAIGESVSANTLAVAMKAAGAENAAQLDVNASFPRFVIYGRRKPGELPMATSGLIPDIAYAPHEYVGRPEGRDFFYLTRKAP